MIQVERPAWELFIERVDKRLCVHCAAPVARYFKVGKCVKAKPCGHKQYQGDPPP